MTIEMYIITLVLIWMIVSVSVTYNLTVRGKLIAYSLGIASTAIVLYAAAPKVMAIAEPLLDLI